MHDEAKLAKDVMVIAVQISGKLRSQIEVAPDASEAAIIAAAKADDKIAAMIEGKAIKREIYVKDPGSSALVIRRVGRSVKPLLRRSCRR